ncbi:MAG: histidine kinase [Clostridia bacterium]|nr:histidine kinase [Clostridia bacterium]
MTTLQYIHCAVELWGAFFCLIAAFVIRISTSRNKKLSYKMIALMLVSALLMISDAIAWLFRGDPSEAGFYIVRIANFAAFFFAFLTMPLVAEFITHIFEMRSGVRGLFWKYIEWALFVIGTILLVINLFHEFIYTFDERNTYYRLAFGVLPGMIAFVGVVITFGVVLEYLQYLRTFEKIATLVYLILPVIAVVLQSFHYGVSFTYLSMVLSAFTLFITFEIEYVQNNIETEKQLAEERIRLFNRQIQPHFVFNSLSVIKHLIRKAPEEAVETVEEFAGYLRDSTDLMNVGDCVPVKSELDLVKHYAYMQQKRFGDSIRYVFDVQDDDFCIPPFSVQTIVENALEHGLRAGGADTGIITVKTYRKGKAHVIEISDNGAGFDTHILDDETQTEHVGIKNTKARLNLMCGGTLDIKSETSKGTVVTMKVPEG